MVGRTIFLILGFYWSHLNLLESPIVNLSSYYTKLFLPTSVLLLDSLFKFTWIILGGFQKFNLAVSIEHYMSFL